ncbi:hypothetical protein HYS96_04845 [Candidatus Daviesbacteria bacterium]|nr:hypothetical protein [Candidatus Daviesbacteria bacterium]
MVLVKGLKAEDRVANSLRRAGASVQQSPGSRGSADVIANWKSGKEWMTQVKYSGLGKPAGLSSRERQNLVSRAERNDATPILAQVTPTKIEYTSAKTGRGLKP